jgi:3-phenylpropionate/cinnamic acid dioxygenase small subunit
MTRPTLEELVDRLEIDDLLTRYATSLDDDTFDALDTVFTPDARIDYSSAVGVAGDYPMIKAWLAKMRSHADMWLHLVGNRRVVIDGDAARSVSIFFCPIVMDGETFFTGGEYHDKLVRTPDGWRIAERVERAMWNYGNLPEVPPS